MHRMDHTRVEIVSCGETQSDTDLKTLFDACADQAGDLSAPDLEAIASWRNVDGGQEGVIFLAVLNQVKAGICAAIVPPDRDHVSLKFLGVRGDARRQGLGVRLETHLSDFSRRRGSSDIRTAFSLDGKHQAGGRFLNKQGWTRNTDAGLRMWRDLNDLPDLDIPGGYSIRCYRPGDEAAFVRIKNAAFAGEQAGGRDWTDADFEKEYLASPHFKVDRVLFAEFEGQLVGTTTAWTSEYEGREIGLIHWVAVVPEHRGKGLGWMLNVAAVHKLKQLAYDDCVLSTNESLSSAVRLYKRLGFQVVSQRSTYTKVLD